LTVILVEQNAKKALETGDRAYLLVSGRKAFEGTAQELLEHKELARLYLGLKTSESA
jgi:branched-chain amino acid transport system ATP-binding protein